MGSLASNGEEERSSIKRKSGKRDPRHSGVERCKGGGDWSGGRCQGGVHPQVLQLCPTGNGRNHPPCCSLWILWSQKENQCLLSLYSICVFIILLLQIAAIVFINVDDANIKFIKDSISTEAKKIDINVETLNPGSKFVQNLFFGVSAGLSAIIFFFTVTLCCRA